MNSVNNDIQPNKNKQNNKIDKKIKKDKDFNTQNMSTKIFNFETSSFFNLMNELKTNQNLNLIKNEMSYGDKKTIYDNLKNINLISPLSLAFIGDAIHTLWVRQTVLLNNVETPKKLHNLASKYCCAKNQANCLDKVYSVLDEKEKDFIRRTRNCKNHNAPKNSNVEEYKKSTCFEALLGYLFVSGDLKRLIFLLDMSCKE